MTNKVCLRAQWAIRHSLLVIMRTAFYLYLYQTLCLHNGQPRLTQVNDEKHQQEQSSPKGNKRVER